MTVNSCSRSNNDQIIQSNLRSISSDSDESIKIIPTGLGCIKHCNKKLGEGGFGYVFEGVYESYGKAQQVAFKLMTASDYVNKESLRLKKLTDEDPDDQMPIVRHIESICDSKSGIHIIVMPKYSSSLHNYIYRPSQRVNLPQVKSITQQILNGLKFLHSNDMIHCDLKPANILIEGPINSSEVKIRIADLGEVHSMHKAPIFPSRPIGTSAYRAPEMIFRDIGFNGKVDIFALGCIVFEMITKTRFLNISNDSSGEEIENVYHIATSTHRIHSDILESFEKTLPLSSHDRTIPNYKPQTISNFTINLTQLCPENRFSIETAQDHSFIKQNNRKLNLSFIFED